MEPIPEKSSLENTADLTLHHAHTLDENRTDCVHCDRRNGEENMVQCDVCQTWWHFSCAGVTDSIKDRSWVCSKCQVDGLSSIMSTSKRSRVSSKSGRSARLNLQLEKLEELQALQKRFVEDKYKLLEAQLEIEEEHESVRSKHNHGSKHASLTKVVDWINECAELKKDNNVPTSTNACIPSKPPSLSSPTKPNAITVSSRIPTHVQQPDGRIQQSPLKYPSLPNQRSISLSANVNLQGDSETGPKRDEDAARRAEGTVPLAQSTPTPVPVVEQAPHQAVVSQSPATINLPASISFPPPGLGNPSSSMPFAVNRFDYRSSTAPDHVGFGATVLSSVSVPYGLPSHTVAPPAYHPAPASVPVPVAEPEIVSTSAPAIASAITSLSAPFLREVPPPVPPGKPDNYPLSANVPPINNDGNLQHLMKQFGSIAFSPLQSPLLNTNIATFTPSPSQLAARQVMPRDLPPFSGNPADWPIFISSFMNTTLACGYSCAENLCRLQRSLKGAAYQSVQSRLLLPESVPHIMETLHLLYGRPELLISALLDKVRSAPSPKIEKFQTIIDFGMSIQSLCDHLEVAGQTAHLSNPSLLAELVVKLPPHLQMEWGSFIQGFPEVNLNTFGSFMSGIVKAVSNVNVYANNSGKSSTPAKNMNSRGNVNLHQSDLKPSVSTHSTTNREDGKSCPACKNVGHRIQDCRVFKSLSVDGRWKCVQSSGLCRNCLNSHGRRSCRKTGNCGTNGCELRHHPLLHSSRSNSDTKVQPLMSTAENQTHRLANQSLLFRIMPITLHGPRGTVDTYAFLDDGSSLTLIEDKLAEELGVDGVTVPLCLLWTANVTRVENQSKKLSLVISSTGGQKFVMDDVQTVKDLSLPTQTLSYDLMSKQYTHLKGLPVKSYIKAVPKLLIGVNNLNLMVPLKIREGLRHEPVAVKTRLGWCIYGGKANNGQKPSVNCHACGCVSDQALHDLVKCFFTMDEVGAQPKVLLKSEDEQRAQRILLETTVRVGNHYETGLLWRYDHIELPDNYGMALKRLECLERRMHRIPQLKETLQKQLEDYQLKGYAHRVTTEELACADLRRVWYLPLGAVVNPRKPGKVRMIWDARAAVNGISLNSVLLKGPDQLASLPGVLVRFRQFNVGVSADIREMFHQISIREEDRHSQRFLWRKDPSKVPDVYLMDVATFGSTCSPASAQYVKNKNAEEFKELYPRAVEGIINNHYVDDSLESYESIEEAIKVSQQMRFVHKQGGFELRNWLSSSSVVLTNLGEVQPEKDKSFAADKQCDYERVLGLLWLTQVDAFSFSIEMKPEITELIHGNESPSKRQMLKCLMSLFDPLGLLGLFVVHGKILLQEVWRAGIQWDEKISDDLHRRWKKWTSLFKAVSILKIPRCYFPGATKDRYKDLQLHIFVDASESAYCAAAYFRTLKPDGLPECVLVTARTKVAPLKSQSIPRLELQAAVLGARLSQFVEENHTLPIARKVMWSDSATVLSWLRADHRRYKQFVAFRIGELLTITDAKHWRWVPSKQNPADIGTKWGNGPDISANSVWFKGPSFLWLSESEWPKEKKSTPPTEEELRPCYAHKVLRIPERLVDLDRFSQLSRATRAVAYVYRFTENLKQKMTGDERSVGPLTSDELRRAECLLIREAQWQCFPDEMVILKRHNTMLPDENQPLMKSSILYQLCPTMDEEGILRVDGRIEAAPNVEREMKFPVILPRKHRLTTLLIDHYHRRYLHCNSETVVNEIRQRYYIPRLRTAVSSIVKACQWCRVYKCSPKIPRMAPLPLARMASFVRPFTYTGIDFFGPLTVKIGRSNAKRWIALFTCLTIRAVHVEVAHNLSTDSCVKCIRRFICRRGSPSEIYSDNGTNFQGAEKLLRKQIEQISATFTGSNTKWIFNPPGTPHMGGAWERMVRSIKAAVDVAYNNNRKLDDESLKTFMVEAEAIVNSRPLTYLPVTSEESEALTPNHFLLGNSSGVRQQAVEGTNSADALRSSWGQIQQQLDVFWNRWIQEYLPTLTKRPKWCGEVKPIAEGDLVFVVGDGKRNEWTRGRIVQAIQGVDGRIRQAIIQTARGLKRRPVARLAVLDVDEGDKTGPGGQCYGGENVGTGNTVRDATVEANGTCQQDCQSDKEEREKGEP